MLLEPTLIEGDAGDTLAVSFWTEDADGNRVAAVPTTVEYRVDCLTTGGEVRDWTAVTPAAQAVTIILTADDTAILNDDNLSEHRRVTVTANRGLATTKTQIYQFWVQNLAAFE